MIFNSNNFTFNNVYSEEVNIHLVSEDTDILNEYGIPFNIEDETSEVTLSFCYAKGNTPLECTYDTIVDVLGWIITDDYCEFISEDNEDIIYFLKGVSYKKRFTNNMTGIIDVTFKVLSPYGYRYYIKEVSSNEKTFNLYNYSNSNNNYKPVIKLSNITTNYITLANTTTGKTPFHIENLTKSDTIYIDNLMGTITDAKGNNKLTNSNRSWIELRKGSNNITVSGTCNIKVEAYYPVMV